jgi:diacylglycerol O-acyltransferase
MTLQKLSGLDTIFLAAESPSNHMHMMAIMVLDPSTMPEGYSFEKLRDFIADRLHVIPQLRRTLVEVPLGLDRPYWVESSDVDLDLHLRRAAVPNPGGTREIARMAEEIGCRLLDRSRPLWEITVVEGAGDGSIVLLAKLHHALMDGIAGMQALASLVSTTPQPQKPPAPLSTSPRAPHIPSGAELLARSIPTWLGKPLQIARAGASVLGSATRAALAPTSDDGSEPVVTTRNFLNTHLSPERSVAYLSLPISAIKDAGLAHGATVNEVILALTGGALRRHYEKIGEPLDRATVAAVPVSTHQQGGDDLSNSYGAMFASVGSEIADPVERLKSIRRASRAEKKREKPFWGEALAQLTDLPSPIFMSFVAQAYTDLGVASRVDPFCNLVVSNVPGPPTTLYLGGARLLDIHALGPIFEGMGLNVTAISVGDNLDLGISACRGIIPDLWTIADGFKTCLEELTSAIEHGTTT